MFDSDPKPVHGVQIVLVEDDDVDARAVVRAFKKARISNPIIRAVDGVDALKMLRDANGALLPDRKCILLVDINMPRMNGIKFVQALRQDPVLRHSIVFMLTTSKRDEDVAAAYDLNVAGYVVKERAGDDFLSLVRMLESFWHTVELPR